MNLTILSSIGNEHKMFWNIMSRSSIGHIFETSFLHSFLCMIGRWMLSVFSVTFGILLLTCYVPWMMRSLCHSGNWNYLAAYLFLALFMIKSSLLLMNLMKLIRKEVPFFQKVVWTYLFPFINNVRLLIAFMQWFFKIE